MISHFPTLAPSPVTLAFPHIQWDHFGSLRLTAQETALLKMADTNSVEYTVADSRDASMYTRVLLKILHESSSVGCSFGHISTIAEVCNEQQALKVLDADPLGVVIHYTISKLYSIINAFMANDVVTIDKIFYDTNGCILTDQWMTLTRILNRGGGSDLFAQSGSALCLVLIITSSCPSMKVNILEIDENAYLSSFISAKQALEVTVSWIINQLKSSTCNKIALAIPAITALMVAPETRHFFITSGGVKYLCLHLKGKKAATISKDKSGASASVQQLYELTFCLWCMTYDLNESANIREDFARDGLAVQVLTELVSSAPREKVVRVALSALVNLATCSENASQPTVSPRVNGDVFLTDMLACRLLKSIEYLEERQFTDPDIVYDLKKLHKLLEKNYKEMSRWEVYKNEVESGHLQWGSTHTEAFFKENARMMEGKDSDFKLVKVLIALLSSKNDEISAIACYDIGEFVRFYPNGRAIAKRLGAKELVMPLIEHNNVELQRHALQCVSKMMVQNWEFVK